MADFQSGRELTAAQLNALSRSASSAHPAAASYLATGNGDALATRSPRRTFEKKHAPAKPLPFDMQLRDVDGTQHVFCYLLDPVIYLNGSAIATEQQLGTLSDPWVDLGEARYPWFVTVEFSGTGWWRYYDDNAKNAYWKLTTHRGGAGGDSLTPEMQLIKWERGKVRQLLHGAIYLNTFAEYGTASFGPDFGRTISEIDYTDDDAGKFKVLKIIPREHDFRNGRLTHTGFADYADPVTGWYKTGIIVGAASNEDIECVSKIEPGDERGQLKITISKYLTREGHVYKKAADTTTTVTIPM